MRNTPIPESVQRELDRLRQDPPIDALQRGPDLRWAHRIVDRHQRGRSVSQIALDMARDAIAGRGIK